MFPAFARKTLLIALHGQGLYGVLIRLSVGRHNVTRVCRNATHPLYFQFFTLSVVLPIDMRLSYAQQDTMGAILLFEDKICEQGVQCIMEIERMAGKEYLTKGYVEDPTHRRSMFQGRRCKQKRATQEGMRLVRSCVSCALQALRCA